MRLAQLLPVGLAFVLFGVSILALPSAQAAGKGLSVPAAAGVAGVGTDPRWTQLTAAQQSALQPLASQWPTLDATSKDKWLNVASRYSQLSPQEQERMQQRMTQWAKLPPKARGEARLRFQQTRQLPPQERQEKWAAYQALSPEDRNALAHQARRKQKPVFLADDIAGPREQSQVFSGRTPVAKIVEKKSNVVPSTLSSSPRQQSAAATLVKAGRGATTTLVNERPTPPQHQQAGLPKIAATKGFVDPQTLLPKKGAQGAAMSPVAESAASRPSPAFRR